MVSETRHMVEKLSPRQAPTVSPSAISHYVCIDPEPLSPSLGADTFGGSCVDTGASSIVLNSLMAADFALEGSSDGGSSRDGSKEKPPGRAEWSKKKISSDSSPKDIEHPRLKLEKDEDLESFSLD